MILRSSFLLLLQFETHIKISLSERLLDEEFVIILMVKLLFHLFPNPPSVIKQTNYIRTLYSKISLRPFQSGDFVMALSKTFLKALIFQICIF